MTLQRIPLQLDFSRQSNAAVEEFLSEARERIARFRARRGTTAPPGFHCSNFQLFDQCLQLVRRQGLVPTKDPRLCEWGAGLGVAACLAARRGWQAFGIEIDDELTTEARRLAAACGVPATFVQGSFLPVGGARLAEELDDLSRFDLHAADAYAELGFETHDFEMIFAYPWPGEARFFEDVFDHFAKPGALLLSFHGSDEYRLQRKLQGRKRGQR